MTNNYPHLSNAPIAEAILDIQVDLPKEVTLDLLYDLHKKVSDEFPEVQKRFTFTGQIDLNTKEEKTTTEAGSKVDGLLFWSENKKRVFQARLNGFTFNMHKPYSNWDEFSTLAKNYWILYFNLVKPINIVRIALRYINNIELSVPFNISKYFNTQPVLGGKLQKNQIYSLFSQVSIQNEKNDVKANITQAIKPSTNDTAKFIFDIDTFERKEFSTDEIWKRFEILREFKDEIFFESITEETLKLFK